MKIMKKLLLIAFALLLLLVQPNYSNADISDVEVDYTNATQLTLNESEVYSLKEAGNYIINGNLSNGLIIEISKEEEIHILLNNITIENKLGPAIYVKSAKKVVLTLAENSNNTIIDGADYQLDEEGANAAIYSKEDLVINGTGALTIQGNTAHGILSKDDLTIISGNINITAIKDALRAKDSLAIKDGNFEIKAGSDGIVSTGVEENTGLIQIENGTFHIQAARDGIEAKTDLTIQNGTFHIQTQSNQITSEDSLKGIKAANNIIIQNGTFQLETQDDSIHSNGNITIHNGNFTISSTKKGLQANEHIYIADGSINIEKSTEGMEGFSVTIDSGTITIVASDDGINATNGKTGTSKQNREQSQEGVHVTINGGTLNITGQNDAIDSNGTITINDGEIQLYVQNPRGGNGTLDANGQVTINGGNVSTNDGAESFDQRGMRQGFAPGFRNNTPPQELDAESSATPSTESNQNHTHQRKPRR